MSKRCSVCSRRKFKGIATVYWRFFVEEGHGVGYRMYYCLDHYTDLVETFHLIDDELVENGHTKVCNRCEKDVGIQRIPMFVYMYPPRQEPWDSETMLCSDCWEAQCNEVFKLGERLEDQPPRAKAAADPAWDRLQPKP
jgi:hypothetical protein